MLRFGKIILISLLGDKMSEFCVHFEGCLCKCDNLFMKDNNYRCQDCWHYINIGKLRYKRYHSSEQY